MWLWLSGCTAAVVGGSSCPPLNRFLFGWLRLACCVALLRGMWQHGALSEDWLFPLPRKRFLAPTPSLLAA